MTAMTFSRRDLDDGYEYGSHSGLLFGFFFLFLLACCVSVSLIYLRKKRIARQMAILPTHQRQGHQRSLTITAAPAYAGRDKVYVYDDKMNLISNSNCRPDSPIPEIRITFPDEVDQESGQKTSGRVVVVRITDTGSIGMEPLEQEQLPPYQQTDAGRFQSLELDRLGGLREREGQAAANQPQPRWS